MTELIRNKLVIRPTTSSDSKLITELMRHNWGGEPLIVRGKNYYPSTLKGILSISSQVVGFLMYEIQENICEIIVFEVLDKLKGVGSSMLSKVKDIAKKQGCYKLLLMTTNDNLDALRFYQKRGFNISGIHLDSMKVSRRMKPSIPLVGHYDIPLRDEIDLELTL